MPYSGKNDPDLPDYIKSKPDKVRSQWVNVWNSTYKACQKANAGRTQKQDCEGRAFTVANGVIKKRTRQQGGMMNGNQLILVELTSEDALTDGRPFDGLAAGTFMDMLFQKAELKEIDFPEIVSNTNEAIEATRTESGELVGLPIDARGHENGDGAGWIIRAEQAGNKIRLTPKWTEIGLGLLKKGIRRFFSATIDLDNLVILGGTLTNWPATRDKKGKILLRPIELEDAPDHTLYRFEDRENVDDEDLLALDALNVAEGEGFDFDRFIADLRANTKKYYEAIEAIFTRKQDAPVDDPALPDDEAGGEQVPDTVELSDDIKSEDQSNTEVFEMEISKEELTELIGTQVRETLLESMKDIVPPQAPEGKDADNDSDNGFDPIAFLEMEDVESSVIEALKNKWSETYDHMQKRALLEAQQMIDTIRREADIRELRNLATTGTDDSPRAFRVEPEALEEFMTTLDKKQLAYFKRFLSTTLEKGLIEFEELGHGRDQEGTLEIPVEVAEKLDSGELTISDLSNPVLALGDLKRYDLSKWRDKE